MNSSDSWIRAVNVVALILIAVALLMNTCAMDRLETQVIKQTKALEAGVGGGAGVSRAASTGSAASSSGSATAEPGTGTGREAVGWGGRRAEILHVEGAAPGAPLSLAEKPKPQGDWYVQRRSSPPSSLNYYATNEGDPSILTGYIYGRLMTVDIDHPPKVEPSLATGWEISEDKLTYTYHLRRGVQFADGRPFTSADVAYSFAVMRDPEVNAEHLRGSYEDVVSLETPDPQTVVVHYRKPYWKGIYAIGFQLRILNKGWYDEQVPHWAKSLGITKFSITPGTPGFGEVFNKISVPCPGASAYYCALERYDKTDRIDLKQNPFYWGIQLKPTWYNFAGLRWVFIEDEVAAAEEFRKGAFDVQSVDFQVYDDVLSKDPKTAEMTKYFEYDHIGIGFAYFNWNCRRPPFDDARVRRAMTMLMDRKWIIQELLRGRGQVATCPTKPAYSSYSKDIEPWPYDPEGAKRLLAEAGWRDSDGDGVLDRNGKRLEFELKIGGQTRTWTQLGAAFEESCRKIGVRATPRPMEWATFIDDFDQRHFDGALINATFPDPWLDPYEDYHSSGDVPRGGNTSGWHTDEADGLLERMRVEFDDDKRDAMWHELNHILHEQQPQTLLYHQLVGVTVSRRIEDVTVRPTGLQIQEFWVKPERVLYK